MCNQLIKYFTPRSLLCRYIKKKLYVNFIMWKRKERDIFKSNLFNYLIYCYTLRQYAITFLLLHPFIPLHNGFSYFFHYIAIMSCIMKQLQSSYFFLARRQKYILSCVAEMDFGGSRYYTLNRMMLSSVGLWPYQKAWPIRIQRFSCIICVVSWIIVQVSLYFYFWWKKIIQRLIRVIL